MLPPPMTEDDLAAWQVYLSTVRIDSCFKMRAKVALSLGHIWISIVDFVVPDVYTGEPRDDPWTCQVPTARPTSETQHWIRSYFLKTLLHEFDECLWIDNKRPFNPHDKPYPIPVRQGE